MSQEMRTAMVIAVLFGIAPSGRSSNVDDNNFASAAAANTNNVEEYIIK
jgi:hypothetical protein